MSADKKVPERAISRNWPRYSYVKDLSLTYEGYGEEVQLQTPDISLQGMFIHTSLVFPEGAVITVKFRLHRLNFLVSARCEVRYRLPGVGIGVEFVEMSLDAQQAIREDLGLDEERFSAEP